MDGGREYDPNRFERAILYIANKSVGDARFGKTKLNKILFFADFTAYRQLGQSITGARYQNLSEGPAPHQLVPRLNALLDSGAVAIREEDSYGYSQQRIMPLRRADLDGFTGAEISILDQVIEDLWQYTARGVSDLSHETIAWR